jgi:type III restriction enzyme
VRGAALQASGRSPHDFKTPLNLAIADHKPERQFIRGLCDRDNAKLLNGWLKNTAQKFYAIEYAWKKGGHPKRGEFSPDFFIKIGDWIFVVEVKDETEIGEPSPENQKKFEYATEHFARLNEWVVREGLPIRDQFNFLTPKDFNKYFMKLREGELVGFQSELDAVLRAAAEAGGK